MKFKFCFLALLLTACISSTPSEKITDKIAFDLVNNNPTLYSIEELKKINGWDSQDNTYTLQYAYVKNLNLTYTELLLIAADEIYNKLDPEREIPTMQNKIQLLMLPNFREFDKASEITKPIFDKKKETHRRFTDNCSQCQKFIRPYGEKTSEIYMIVRAASMLQAIVVIERNYGISAENYLNGKAKSEIQFSVRKTEKGWDVVK